MHTYYCFIQPAIPTASKPHKNSTTIQEQQQQKPNPNHAGFPNGVKHISLSRFAGYRLQEQYNSSIKLYANLWEYSTSIWYLCLLKLLHEKVKGKKENTLIKNVLKNILS